MPDAKQAAAEFLANKRIAVTGVSRNPKGHGSNIVYQPLRQRGYEVFAVNPNAETVEGDRCYHDLGSIPGGVDAVVIGTRPELAESTMRECAELGIRQVWMHRGPGAGTVSRGDGGRSPSPRAFTGVMTPGRSRSSATPEDRGQAMPLRRSGGPRWSQCVQRVRGHVVALTGDGVYNGRAPREAHIGVAIGAARTDVGRRSRRAGACRRLLRINRGSSRRAGDFRQRTALPHLPPDGQRRRTHPVRRVVACHGKCRWPLSVVQILALDIGTDCCRQWQSARTAEPTGVGQCPW